MQQISTYFIAKLIKYQTYSIELEVCLYTFILIIQWNKYFRLQLTVFVHIGRYYLCRYMYLYALVLFHLVLVYK